MAPQWHFPRLWWGLAWCWVALVVLLSLMPQPPQIPGDRGNWGAHLAAYAGLAAWFCRLQHTTGKAWRILAALSALGVLIECLQGLSGYRFFDAFDMLANATGAALGCLLAPPRLPNGLSALDAWLAQRWRRA